MTEEKELTKAEMNFLAIQGIDPDNHKSGLKCDQCGCTDMRVRNTIQADGEVKRYRVCRNCGTSRRTKEIFG